MEEKEIVGHRYGHLTQISGSFRNSRKDYPKAFFMCDCGNVIAVNKNVVLKHHLFDRCRTCKKEMDEKLNSNTK
jgi:hypothetical protein|nr:MAG TPA: desulfoferrodoxin-like protein [Caudoviricetes sp.]